MELFSEIYNCYYQIMRSILENHSGITLEALRTEISKNGYEESLFYLIPKLTSKEWNLLEQNGELYISKLSDSFHMPLTGLQRAYIKTVLQDNRIRLFFDENQLTRLETLFAGESVLWQPEDFYYYDRFSNPDNYESPLYQQHFRTLITAIHNRQYVDIFYESHTKHRIHRHYLPCRLEYSIKNDKFRLLGILRSDRKNRVEILNLERMKEVSLLPEYANKLPDINKSIRTSYYKEPVHLRIHTDRNALERTMLQFANYEKNTTKINDNTYECFIYYNQKMETELLIEVLSFGPMVEVLGSERFLELVKQRLRRQKHVQNAT